MQYSPLCDTNVLAYLAYVAGSRDGAVFDAVGGGVGGGEVEVNRSGTVGVGGSLGVLFSSAFTDEGVRFLGGVAFGDGCGGVGVDRVVDVVPEQFVRYPALGGTVSSGVGRVCRSEGNVVVGDSGLLHEAKVESTADAVGVSVEEVLVGEEVSVGSSVGGGGKKKKMGKNQRDRAKYGKFGVDWRKSVGPEVSYDVKTKARESLEKKWEVENRVAIAKAELAEEKAKKDLEFQRARDVDAEIRRSRTLVMKQTESNKVATEKAFASLKATGNVSGFCETVMSGGESVPGLSGGSSSAEGCTISPDSSASMHEFREAQKKIADLEFQNKKLVRQLEFGKLAAGEEATFTVYSDGDVSKSVRDEINRHITDWHDVDERDDSYGDDRAHTLFVKKISVPSADEYAYDLIGQ